VAYFRELGDALWRDAIILRLYCVKNAEFFQLIVIKETSDVFRRALGPLIPIWRGTMLLALLFK